MIQRAGNQVGKNGLFRGFTRPVKPAMRLQTLPRQFRSISNGAPPPMIKRRVWPWFVVGAVGIFAAWKWYTWHHFPESVANLLRKGLMAEINGGGYRVPDRQLALKYYLEALKEADQLHMSPVCDEYTGIQLKIAEMYEHLGLLKEAAFVYMEVMGVYLVALNTNGGTGLIPRDYIIKRDLMVAIMLGRVLKDPSMNRQMLLPHMEIAIRRAAENSDESLPVFFNPSLLLDFHEGRIPQMSSKVSDKNEGAWADFRDEAFALREMVTIACMEQSDFWQAALFKYHTTLLMLSSGFDLGECLMSLCNVGSLACLQAINFETANKKLANPQVSNPEGIVPKPDLSKGVLPSDYISVSSLDMVKAETDLSATFLEMSDKVYKNVISTIEGMSTRRTLHVNNAYVMAVFGQGVNELKRGNFDKASDLLYEARIRAKGCDLEDLMDRIGGEIEKLDKIRESGKQLSEFAPDEIPEINVVFWKIDTPELRNKPDN